MITFIETFFKSFYDFLMHLKHQEIFLSYMVLYYEKTLHCIYVLYNLDITIRFFS